MELIQDYQETEENTANPTPVSTEMLISPQNLQYTMIDSTPSAIKQEIIPVEFEKQARSNNPDVSEYETHIQTIQKMVAENIRRAENQEAPSLQDILNTFNLDFQKVPVAIGNNQFIEFELVINDGSDESNMKLIALKNIFSKQLPKMPKEYIVRLVFDKRHISLAIKRNQRIIGGICYRAYGPQRFAEIAFCAVNSSEQVKGFGTKLMNQLKFVAQRTGIEYFLTYADNFAIGYFQKQGFSKHISMPKERWVGFIKDYDGGTLMECYVHPGVNYLDISSLVAKQKRFIMDRVKENSLSHITYPGLTVFQSGRRLQNIMDIPGVVEGRWTTQSVYRSTTERDRTMNQSKLHGQLKTMMEKIRSNKLIRQLMCYEYTDTTLPEKRQLSFERVNDLLRQGDYYRSKEALGADLLRMVEYYRAVLPETPTTTDLLANLKSYFNEVFFDRKEKDTTNDQTNSLPANTNSVHPAEI